MNRGKHTDQKQPAMLAHASIQYLKSKSKALEFETIFSAHSIQENKLENASKWLY